jgi:hypothetical protein
MDEAMCVSILFPNYKILGKTLFRLGSAASYTATHAGAWNTRPSGGAERTW